MKKLVVAVGLVLALTAGLSAELSASGTPVPRCARAFHARAPIGLPAPVVLQTPCARFVVQPDGTVSAEPLPSTPLRVGSISLSRGAWLIHRDMHLLAYRDGKTLWRSAGRFPLSDHRHAWGVLGKSSIAFVYGRDLYVASLDGRERRVGRDEQPVGWSTRGELYTFLGHRHHDELRLRSASGKLLGTIASRVGESSFEPGWGTVVYRSHGGLFRADGLRRHEIVRFSSLGFRHGVWGQPVDEGLVEVSAGHRSAVLYHNGSVFGRLPLPFVWFTAAGDRHAIAYTANRSVYVLDARSSAPRRVYRGLPAPGCSGDGVTLAWHADWLLVNSSQQGKVVALDTSSGRRVDLTRLVRRLPANLDWPAGDSRLQATWA